MIHPVSAEATLGTPARRGLGDVRWLAEILWQSAGDAVTIRATSARQEASEAYAVVPAASRPRFLVPLASRAAAAASLHRYNRLRSGATRAARWGIGLAMQTGAGAALFRDRLLVGHGDEPPVLTRHLRQVLGREDIAIGVGIGRRDPTRKPVLQIFSLGGRPLGFVKIGWNAVTHKLVRTEAAALEAWGGRDGGLVHLPRLLHQGTFGDFQLSVTAPLPTDVRAHRPVDRPPPLEAVREVGALGGIETTVLGETSYWRQLLARVRAAADTGPQDIEAVLRGAAAALEARAAGLEVELGTWHGDWVPWNLGWAAGRLYVFDWEHSATRVPIGLDVLHYHFQVELILHGRNVGAAAAAARARGLPLLPPLGVRHRALPWLALIHLLEVFLRAHEMRLAGGGVQTRVYPAIIGAIQEAAWTLT
jgi:hypothetical protein